METSMIARLSIYLSMHRHTKFALGEMDCCLFAVHWIDFSTGQKTASKFMNTYSTDAELETAFQAAKVTEYLTDQGYVQTVAPKCCDILLKDEHDHSSAWLVLNNKAYTMSPRGLIRVPTSKLTDYTVWRKT